MTTIITMDQNITNVPANTPTIQAIGDVLFSDKFNRAGQLGGSAGDLFAGGTARTWGGTAQAANATATTNGGQLTIGAAGVSSECVDMGRPDVTVSMKLLEASTTMGSGQNAMIELRKASANTGDTCRFTLSAYFAGTGTQLNFYKRVGGSATLIANGPNWKIGETLKIDMKGNRIRVWINEILQMDLTDASLPNGNFFGFATSSNNRPWTITDYVIRGN